MPASAATSALLSVRGLAFARNERPVFGPLAFDVEPGEALLVQGDNGAGKTTLLRVLAGLLRADAGCVDIAGHEADHRTRSRHVAYLGHLPALLSEAGFFDVIDTAHFPTVFGSLRLLRGKRR